jgi:hypothetical protein
MSRNKAGDETNRALVAYVRKLSDEELADLLLSLDPKVYQDLLEQPADGVVADRMPLTGERLGQLPGGLAGPPQQALRVAAGIGGPPAGPTPAAGPDQRRAAAWGHSAAECAPEDQRAGRAPPRHDAPSAGTPRPSARPG